MWDLGSCENLVIHVLLNIGSCCENLDCGDFICEANLIIFT